MRILHIINCFSRSGGAEKLVLDLALAQKRRGDDVSILSLIEPASDNTDFLQIASDSSIPVSCLHNGKLLSPVLFIKLRNYVKDNTFDVVHAHLFPTLYYCSLLRRYFKSLYFTEHSTNNRRRKKIFSLLDRYIYKRFDCTICISDEVQKKLVEHVGGVNTEVVPNGIPLKEFSTAEPYDRKEIIGVEEGRIIVMVARFIESKDHITLFNSLKHLPDDVHVVCVGTGPAESLRKKYCEENGLLDRVHFLGVRRDVSRIIRTADVVVLSTAYEGFSISMLESMASGRPFIASRVPGVEDLIDKYTELFPFGDSKELAKIVSHLLADQSYYESTVAKNQEFASHYDIDSICEEYARVYSPLKKRPVALKNHPKV